MNPHEHISYLIEIGLEVSRINEPAQKSYFSIGYTLMPVERQSRLKGAPDEQMFLGISMIDPLINLDKSLVKSSDFLRRCAYRYDGMQVGIDPMGGIAVLNGQALSQQWATIRSLLQADYKGFFAEDYILRINRIMESSEVYHMPMNNYFYYGLIFFGIPLATRLGWCGARSVMLSDFDDVLFEETLKCELEENDTRCFSIVGNVSGEPEGCQINQFYGRTQIPVGSPFPDWTHLEVAYTKDDLNVYWKYELTQQEE